MPFVPCAAWATNWCRPTRKNEFWRAHWGEGGKPIYPLWLNPQSLTSRLLLVAGLWVALVLSAGGFVLSTVFHDFVENGLDKRLSQTLDAMIGASELAAEGYVRFTHSIAGQQFVEPYSGWYWQVSVANQEAFRSRSLWDQELAVDLSAPTFKERTYEAAGLDGQVLRIKERDIVLPGSEAVFRYMVASDTGEIRAEIGRFDRIVAWALGGLGVGLLAAVILQVTFGLMPLRRIRSGLSAIRTGRSRRLDRGYPPEVLPLVDEVNAVLDHNEELVDRARTHVGNLAHALKTPLSVMANEAAAAGDSKLGEIVGTQAATIRRHVDHHLVRARAAGRNRLRGTRADVGAAIADLARALERIYLDSGIKFSLDCEDELQFWGERQDLDEILGNIMDNAAKWAKNTVRVSARRTSRSDGEDDETRIIIVVEDDGPGVPEDQLQDLFRRGERLDESKPGSGLGLDIVRDLTDLSGGSVLLAIGDSGGLMATIELPAAPV